MTSKIDKTLPQIQVRMDPALLHRLRLAADERTLSTNFMVNKAVEYFLDHLIPVEELKFTKD